MAFLMRRYGYPLAPVMIGVVLGPLAETSLRNALMSSGGELSILLGSGITITLYALLAAMIGYSLWRRIASRRRQDV